MFLVDLVHFDDNIPNWRTKSEVLNVNVLVLVTEGKVSYSINGIDYVGERGDFIFIPHGTRRAGDNHHTGPHQKYTVIFRYDENAVPVIPFLQNKQFVQFKLRNFQYAQRRFERLFEEVCNGGNYLSFICPAILQELIGMLARELEKPEVTPMKMKYAQLIKHYLLDHYREPIEIGQLARLIHRSPNYTTSVFREVIGHSPIKYIHLLRIREACSLLLSTDMTVANISSYLGYYDTSYFFRIFKKHTAMSPTDFMIYGKHTDHAELFP
ncbi:helix-turn-helix domain-containing protein [Paenibacillus nasutitermitis]|uniref:HTH araC/xylS-type domain-containing protein n=1 Tax=Paenibacillus nasutitermitis TaxID=1652958 RepID=A0A916Z795_9BACL|nr:helix-turn-helix domain-containing protein [Paenibacillus nasutitermitis]GGD78575.1 hypothetical protein GCM10010911_40820 [Paenibacillus nasutitermitis]